MLQSDKLKYHHPNNFFLMAGFCAIVSEVMTFRIAEKTMKLKSDFLEHLLIKLIRVRQAIS
jgi:3-deoxy-D-manno-octulosonic acid (KDO) 8-phosphate synthase